MAKYGYIDRIGDKNEPYGGYRHHKATKAVTIVADLLKDLKKASKNKKRGAGLRAVIAAKEDIKNALEEGFSKKEIWLALRAKNAMPIDYPQFSEHVRKRIEIPAEKPLFTPKEDNSTTEPVAASEETSSTTKEKNKDAIKSFQHSAKPNKDSLI